eukprot:Selendium_serpulae@DN3811_c0_g1_i1.p1
MVNMRLDLSDVQAAHKRNMTLDLSGVETTHARNVTLVSPRNPRVPLVEWNAFASQSTADINELTLSPRNDPFQVAKSARTARGVAWGSATNGSSRQINNRNTRSQWVSTEIQLTLPSYLSVFCPEAFREHYSKKKIILRLIHERKVRSFDVSFDFEALVLRLGRKEKDGSKYRRKIPLQSLTDCNDHKAMQDYLQNCTTVSRLPEWEQYRFCALYVEDSADPIIMLDHDQQVLSQIVILAQNIINYFNIRGVDEQTGVMRCNGFLSEVLQDLNLRDIFYREAAKYRSSISKDAINEWREGIFPCSVIDGDYVFQNVTLAVDARSACIRFLFGKDSNKETTPHPHLLADGCQESVATAITTLDRQIGDGSLRRLATFQAKSGSACTRQHLRAVKQRRAVVVSSPKWRTFTIFVFPSSEIQHEFLILTKLLNKTHLSVLNSCTKTIVEAGGG